MDLIIGNARLAGLDDGRRDIGIDAQTPEQAIAAFKNGRRTMRWNPPEPMRP